MKAQISNDRIVMTKKKLISSVLLLLMLVGAWGCRFSYKFTGASIPPEAKTISIAYFPNQAALVNPNLSQSFTEGMRDFFLRQVRLSMVDRGGDLSFEGEIKNYRLDPVSVQADAMAAMTRLTIEVNVRFTNRFDAEQDFEKTFSQYVEFDNTVDFSSAEQDLVDEISDLIYDKVFNESLANW